MYFDIVNIKPSDAKAMIDYLKKIGGESNNLSFGAEGLPVSVEDEVKYIESVLKDNNSISLLAKKDGVIIGDCSITGNARRFSHRGELGISVVKEYWNKGVGAALLKKALEITKEKTYLEVISLEVRSDNHAAIHLYEKFGFVRIATFEKFFKIDGEYFSAELMNLYL